MQYLSVGLNALFLIISQIMIKKAKNNVAIITALENNMMSEFIKDSFNVLTIKVPTVSRQNPLFPRTWLKPSAGFWIPTRSRIDNPEPGNMIATGPYHPF